MNKRTVALIALFAGWILTADIANATTYEDIAGQWCGDVTVYVFTPDTLTTKFHDRRPENVFKITMPLVAEPPKKPRRKLSKAELRQQAAAAFLAWRAGQTSKNK